MVYLLKLLDAFLFPKNCHSIKDRPIEDGRFAPVQNSSVPPHSAPAHTSIDNTMEYSKIKQISGPLVAFDLGKAFDSLTGGSFLSKP